MNLITRISLAMIMAGVCLLMIPRLDTRDGYWLCFLYILILIFLAF